ncbi:hypothetical protein BESB_023850 [Besnoitia besnoiti]|uniref:Uncharacterized protein n=1 Tax=Besnoitia besnoiti TaxID=94643 RepID=A0A2A9M886_BESBE|nr:hypothetical protein BESB_023850 [Besnoitia besnoiti]PFH31893.1 hypothetical protein BESB_023850 [Besnoitia besnoiti]
MDPRGLGERLAMSGLHRREPRRLHDDAAEKLGAHAGAGAYLILKSSTSSLFRREEGPAARECTRRPGGRAREGAEKGTAAEPPHAAEDACQTPDVWDGHAPQAPDTEEDRYDAALGEQGDAEGRGRGDAAETAQAALAFASSLAETLRRQLEGQRTHDSRQGPTRLRDTPRRSPWGGEGDATDPEPESGTRCGEAESHRRPSPVSAPLGTFDDPQGSKETAEIAEGGKASGFGTAAEEELSQVQSVDCRCRREWRGWSRSRGNLRICCSRFPYIALPQVDRHTIASLFRLQLFPYQLAGVHWLSLLCGSTSKALSDTLGGFVLADEAGMGSSVQTAMLLSLAYQMGAFELPSLLIVSSCEAKRQLLDVPRAAAPLGRASSHPQGDAYPFASAPLAGGSGVTGSPPLALAPRVRRWLRVFKRWAPALSVRLLLHHFVAASSLCGRDELLGSEPAPADSLQDADESLPTAGEEALLPGPQDLLTKTATEEHAARGAAGRDESAAGRDESAAGRDESAAGRDESAAGRDEADLGGGSGARRMDGAEAEGEGAAGESSETREGGRETGEGRRGEGAVSARKTPHVLVITQDELLQYPSLLANAFREFGGLRLCIFDLRDAPFPPAAGGLPPSSLDDLRESGVRRASPPPSGPVEEKPLASAAAASAAAVPVCSRPCRERGDSVFCEEGSLLYAAAGLVDSVCREATGLARRREGPPAAACEGNRTTCDEERGDASGNQEATADGDRIAKKQRQNEQKPCRAETGLPQKLLLTNTDPSSCPAALRRLLPLLLPSFFASTGEVDSVFSAHLRALEASSASQATGKKRAKLSLAFLAFARQCVYPLVLRRLRAACMLPLLPPLNGEVHLLSFSACPQAAVYVQANQKASRALCDAVLASCREQEEEDEASAEEDSEAPSAKSRKRRHAEAPRAETVEANREPGGEEGWWGARKERGPEGQQNAMAQVAQVAQEMVQHLLLVAVHPMLAGRPVFSPSNAAGELASELEREDPETGANCAQEEKRLRERVALALSETVKLPLGNSAPLAGVRDLCKAARGAPSNLSLEEQAPDLPRPPCACACACTQAREGGRRKIEDILARHFSPWEVRRLGGALGVCRWRLSPEEACQGVKIKWLRDFLATLGDGLLPESKGNREKIGANVAHEVAASDQRNGECDAGASKPQEEGGCAAGGAASDGDVCAAPAGSNDARCESESIASAVKCGEEGSRKKRLRKVVILNPLCGDDAPTSRQSRTGATGPERAADELKRLALHASSAGRRDKGQGGAEAALTAARTTSSLASFLQAALGKMIFVIPYGSSKQAAAQVFHDFLREDPADVPALLVEDLAVLFQLRPHSLALVSDLVWLATPASPLPRPLRDSRVSACGATQSRGAERDEEAVWWGEEKKEKGDIVRCVRRDVYASADAQTGGEEEEDGCFIVREDIRQVENCFRCVGHATERLSVYYLCCEGSIDEVCFRSTCAAEDLLRLS